MPWIHSKVSVTLTEDKKEVLKERLGKAIEAIPGKSEEWLMLGFEENCSLYFRGNKCSRAAFVEVKIVGSASEEAYAKMTEILCRIFEEELDIPQNQIYITYQEINNWGYDGRNF